MGNFADGRGSNHVNAMNGIKSGTPSKLVSPWRDETALQATYNAQQALAIRSRSEVAHMILGFVATVVFATIAAYPPGFLQQMLREFVPHPRDAIFYTALTLAVFSVIGFLVDVYRQVYYRFFVNSKYSPATKALLGFPGSPSSSARNATLSAASTKRGGTTGRTHAPPSATTMTSPLGAAGNSVTASGGLHYAAQQPRRQDSTGLTSPGSGRRLRSRVVSMTSARRTGSSGGYRNTTSPFSPASDGGRLTSPLRSPGTGGRISDQQGTSELLERWRRERRHSGTGSAPVSPMGSMGIDSMAGLGGGLGEGLQTFMYQMAQYLPGRVAPRQVEKTTSDEGWPVKAHTQVWTQYFGLSETDLSVSVDALREWLSATVMTHIANMVDEANGALRAFGDKTLLVGTNKVEVIKDRLQKELAHWQYVQRARQAHGQVLDFQEKQTILTMEDTVRTMQLLGEYLSVHANQAYLVARIRTLAEDKFLGGFQHAGGETRAANRWSPECPTDAQIVMHCFCCYISEHAYRTTPFDSNASAISSAVVPPKMDFWFLHYVKSPQKLSDVGVQRGITSLLYLYRSSHGHFQIALQLLDDDDNPTGKFEIWDFPADRKNVFQALVYFLYQVCEKQNGILDPYAVQSFGRTGLNISRELRFPSDLPHFLIQNA